LAASFARERFLELGHVLYRTDGPEMAGECGLVITCCRAACGSDSRTDLSKSQEEALLGSVSVDGGALAVQRVFHGHVSDARASLSPVLAQGQLAVQL